MLRCAKAVAASLALLASSAIATAQVCVPAVTGLPSGPQPPTDGTSALVLAMMPFDDASGLSLIAAGKFTLIGAQGDVAVARYQGGRWTRLGTNPFGTARSLTQIDLSANGGPARSIYAAGDNGFVQRWNGTQWVLVGTNNFPAQPIDTLLSYSDSQGPVLLAASSSSSGIKAWRGSGAWTPYPSNGLGPIHRLKILNDGTGPALFAIGSNISKLVNGQWQPYDAPPVTSFSYFEDMEFFDDGVDTGPEPYVSGAFQMAGAISNAARKRSGVWQPLGGGVSIASGTTGPRWFTIDEGAGPQLFLAGPLQSLGNYAGLLKWTSAGWQAPSYFWRDSGSVTGAVQTMLRFNDGEGAKTYMGGTFSTFSNSGTIQPPFTPAPAIVQANSGSCQAMDRGLGVLSSNITPYVRYDLATLNLPEGPRLFAGAPFTRAGGHSAVGAALFDGSDWSALSVPTTVVPITVHRPGLATFNGQVRIFAGLHNSNPPGLLAYWDGVQWVRFPAQPGGANLGQIATFDGVLHVLTNTGLYRFNGTSWQLLTSTSTLIAAAILGDLGSGQRLFFANLGASGPGIYQFDGATVSLLGPNTGNGVPTSLHIHNDGSGPMLYVAGSELAGGIQRLRNNVWERALTTGGVQTSTNSPIAFATFDDGAGPALYAAGSFSSFGSIQSNGFVRMRNNTWSSVYPYASPAVGIDRASLAVFNNRLYIAGNFTQLNGAPADHLAYIPACPRTCVQDFNNDGDSGTDADIEAFFQCLAGNCCNLCTADFNNDGDIGTDADIESFFRVLAGGPC